MSTPKSSTASSKVRKHLALFDVHVPHNIKLNSTIDFIKDYRPDEFIIGGDFLNLEWASHWNEKEFKTIGLEKLSGMLKQELNAGKDVLRQLVAALPEDCNKYYIPGNHEDWLYWACLTYPQLAGGISLGVEQMTFKSDLADIRKHVLADLLREHLKTDELNMKVLPFGKELVLGKLTYIHGHQVGTLTSMQKKFPARNMVCGHHHTHQVTTTHNSGDEKKANQYVMVPCMCKLSPGYLTDGSTRWLNGFWTAEVLSNGLFDGRVIKVLDGKVIFNGKVYE
jgi:hypothetical protein